MANTGNWTILGTSDLAEQLNEAARYIEAPTALTVSTDPDDVPANAITTGAALLADGARSAVSQLNGFRVLESVFEGLAAYDIELAVHSFPVEIGIN